MTDKERNEKMAEVSRLDYEITKEVTSGRHKPFYGDKFQEKRDRILKLRIELFPNSVWALGIKKE
jgi:hypothetical protein